ncbi:hypothetical protein FGE12_19525 [Aggregicoccus sp. 17bor-14]|uniref:YncE family protein n=1 Tax=Myxococcaceae TaxID=31 RepID=UPI00129CCEE4|nr:MULTISPECIES: hypothetical protein [Myxococcaceae]MBF5044600.1 hypothetical protein [Simulacricoccus sp. 17bor-14]MRI90344.1 hypothetical protein [Aggregicoccus sp. 17bor-14]
MSQLLALPLLLALQVPSAPTSIPLPGEAPVAMDYLAFDPATHRVLLPAGNTGRLDVVDTTTGKLTALESFPTAKRGERTVGLSSVTVGEGSVFVGNRADWTVCALEQRSLAREGCVKLASQPDGVMYVPATKEVWVTLPEAHAMEVLDVKNPASPAVVARVPLAGEPEGYALDAARGLVYTNLEDADRTVVIDARARRVLDTWKPGCGEAGPRGLAFDASHRQLAVACTDRVKLLDAAHAGAIRAELGTGGGVDNPAWDAAHHRLYVASGKTATLTIVDLSHAGELRKVASAPTAQGGRNVAVDADGTAYVPDSRGGRLVVVRFPR